MPAAADECGELTAGGYTATRAFGPLRMRVTVGPDAERIDNEDGLTEITKGSDHFILNPAKKTFGKLPPGAAIKPPKEKTYVEKVPDGELTQVTLAFNTPEGKKEWLSVTTCRPDGIFVEKKIRTPKGPFVIRQDNIQPGPVPPSTFEIPSDYKQITLGKPPR